MSSFVYVSYSSVFSHISRLIINQWPLADFYFDAGKNDDCSGLLCLRF